MTTDNAPAQDEIPNDELQPAAPFRETIRIAHGDNPKGHAHRAKAAHGDVGAVEIPDTASDHDEEA
jgi:hypothetical protein